MTCIWKSPYSKKKKIEINFWFINCIQQIKFSNVSVSALTLQKVSIHQILDTYFWKHFTYNFFKIKGVFIIRHPRHERVKESSNRGIKGRARHPYVQSFLPLWHPAAWPDPLLAHTDNGTDSETQKQYNSKSYNEKLYTHNFTRYIIYQYTQF